jgi:Ca2+-binding RTX toxin-like protein
MCLLMQVRKKHPKIKHPAHACSSHRAVVRFVVCKTGAEVSPPFFFRPATERKAMVMRRSILVLVSLVLAMMLLASGVALAKNINGTYRAEKLIGTAYADIIRAGDGNDVVFALAGADEIRGDSGEDRLHGGKGNDRFYSAGLRRDVIYCGPGIDWAEVNSSDRVVNCERVKKVTP